MLEYNSWISYTCASGSVGGVQPCQGWGRGFESRLALLRMRKGYPETDILFCYVQARPGGNVEASSPSRASQSERPPDVLRRLTLPAPLQCCASLNEELPDVLRQLWQGPAAKPLQPLTWKASVYGSTGYNRIEAYEDDSGHDQIEGHGLFCMFQKTAGISKKQDQHDTAHEILVGQLPIT